MGEERLRALGVVLGGVDPAAVRGARIASTVMIVVGSLFILSALATLAVPATLPSAMGAAAMAALTLMQ